MNQPAMAEGIKQALKSEFQCICNLQNRKIKSFKVWYSLNFGPVMLFTNKL